MRPEKLSNSHTIAQLGDGKIWIKILPWNTLSLLCSQKHRGTLFFPTTDRSRSLPRITVRLHLCTPSPSPRRSSPTTLSFSFAEPRLYVNDHLITAHCYLERCWGVEFASIFRYVSIFLWTPQATITVACLSVRRFYNSLLFIRVRIYKPDILTRKLCITVSELGPFWEDGVCAESFVHAVLFVVGATSVQQLKSSLQTQMAPRGRRSTVP